MGLFSSKKKTYVSSVVYPLGEDGADRTDVLKYTVINSVLQERPIGDSIRETFLRGQGISLRNAFTYARDKYTAGLATSVAQISDEPDLVPLVAVLAAQNKGAEILCSTVFVGTAKSDWWAERYLAETYGFDRNTQRFISPPKGVEPDANVAYDMESDGSIQILLMNADGATTILHYRPTDFVRMANYVHCAYQTQRTYENGTTTSTRTASTDEEDSTIVTTDTQERAGETQITTRRTVTTVANGVATVTVTETIQVTSRTQYLLYRLGSGVHPELDNLVTVTPLTSPYFPAVPLRVNNGSMVDKAHQQTAQYKTSKQLLKMVGLNLEDLGKSVEDNPNLKDIDYCFVVFGVRLNTTSPEGKAYLFRFFQYLRSISHVTSAQYKSWEDGYYKKYGESSVGMPTTNSVEIYSPKARADNYDIKLQWQYIDTRLVTGMVKPGASPGTVTVQMGGSKTELDLGNDMVLDASILLVRRQVDANTYEELEIAGLTYENFIYKGKSIIITAHDAMSDPDEDGFIIPLNQADIRAMPLGELTNLAYQCMHIVFNCYKVVKKKWYQTGIFKVVIVVAAIVVVALSWGAGTPAATAMTTAAFSVAAALGATGILLTYLAATLYVMSMIVISAILTKVSTEAFGKKWGPIIGMIAAAMVAKIGSPDLTKAPSYLTASNVIKATSAVTESYLERQMEGIQKDLVQVQADYKTGMEKIEEMTQKFLGTNVDLIDIQGLTEASWQLQYEHPDDFLTRTLMTGSDVCTITTGMIEHFADVGLWLPVTG